ncbi:MAG: protein TolQ [Gammaproteobacteria bacterium RIFCSPHIGHO2_12_FULL_35_23]|nr:MAG: protein TolQ [Gammaproteobacteria bacterium RIFCSPHIGHO2_12_FULL_35_23]
MPNQPILAYFFNANIVVQLVVLILLVVSVFSWAAIFQKWLLLAKTSLILKRFEKKFWKTQSLDSLYQSTEEESEKNEGLPAVFCEGYKAFKQLQTKKNIPIATTLETVQRTIRASLTYEEEALNSKLPMLATIGSTSPYIGLFGTVWGIMMSFHALGTASEVTIAMVAPGISSALVATAMGLFAAIPAVIFYNRYMNKVDQILNRYDAFCEQFISLLQYKAMTESTKQIAEETYA